MNRDETTKLINRVFVLFPSFKSWFDELPSRNATGKAWMDALGAVDYVDALAVLDAWATGKQKPPAGFERDQTIYRLAANARELANLRHRREQAAQEVSVDVKARRAAYEALPRFSGSAKKAYDKILSRKHEYEDGKMTGVEWVEWCKVCAEEVA
jgi:hypothetical protein